MKAQIITPVTASCQPTATLTALGFTAQGASQVTNGTCKNYYNTNGACANVGGVINAMNNNNYWLMDVARNANLYAAQYINATIYFQTLNGFVNASTVVPAVSGWLGNVTNFFKNLANRATSLFSTAVVWLQNVFNNTVGQINPCFQAWANLTNGAFCVATSSSIVPYMTSASLMVVPLTLIVDPTSTGQAVASCNALIDTYCSLTFGISISNSNLPFNATFNWADGGISQANCLAMKANYNGTNNAAALNLLYTSLFQTNMVPFVPSLTAVTNLGSFLTATTAANVTSYMPTQQTATGVGIKVQASTTTNPENLLVDGQNSGQAKMMYGSAMIMFVNVFIALFAFMF